MDGAKSLSNDRLFVYLILETTMKLAVIADIHANLIALQAVVADIDA